MLQGCKFLVLICCLLLIFGCQASKETKVSMFKVEQVISGQSLEVIDTKKQSKSLLRVRLIGIDAPDLKQEPWGTAAQMRLQELIGKQPVVLESDAEVKDQYQRQLAYVWRDRTLLNEQLVKEGLALFVPRTPNNKYDQKLAHAQEFARLMGLGIWNPQQPMRLTPSEFRSQYR